jgi:hypothetical protein
MMKRWEDEKNREIHKQKMHSIRSAGNHVNPGKPKLQQ